MDDSRQDLNDLGANLMAGVSIERTLWRDDELGLLHRTWGEHLPAIDIDYLMIEYNGGTVVGVIEYKHEQAKIQYLNYPNNKALINLCDRANTPLFAVRYANNFSWWKVKPLNRCATAKTNATSTIIYNEMEYVKFVYSLRNIVMPINIENQILNNIKPNEMPKHQWDMIMKRKCFL